MTYQTTLKGVSYYAETVIQEPSNRREFLVTADYGPTVVCIRDSVTIGRRAATWWDQIKFRLLRRVVHTERN